MVLASACSLSCKRDEPAPVAFEKATLTIRDKDIVVEVANTDTRRERGLMYRQSLPRDQGMLFVYRDEATRLFWMKNTHVPLDIAFIKADGWICDIKQMEAEDLGSYESDMRAKFALEMNKGWFAANGAKVGDTIEIPPEVVNSAQ